MQNIAYITQSILSLSEIRRLAEEKSYRTDLFFEIYEMLNIHFGEDESEWWQWRKIIEQELLFDDSTDYEELERIIPKSIFVVQYHANTLSTLAYFLKALLTKYGGWIDCKGSLKNAYTLENIDDMVAGCI